jgi:hypothetical protein
LLWQSREASRMEMDMTAATAAAISSLF